MVAETHFIGIVTIGSVQRFIEQSRRTSDLWFGSQLLSYLAVAGFEVFPKDYQDINLIYPSRVISGSFMGVPNRFMFRATSHARAAAAATAAERAIQDRWEQVAHNTYEKLAEHVRAANASAEGHWSVIWERQVKNWLEIYWVVVEYTGTYQEAVRFANQALEARKLARSFPRLREPGEKCTLTGEMQALYFSGNLPKDADDLPTVPFEVVRGDWQALSKVIRNPSLIRDDERLCAISAIKRFAHTSPGNEALSTDRFPSTSSIASATFRADVLQKLADNPSLQDAVDNHLGAIRYLFDEKPPHLDDPENLPSLQKLLGNLRGDTKRVAGEFIRIDGDYFYPETFLPKRIEEYLGREPDVGRLYETQRTLSKLYRALGRVGISRPHSYLAILMMDGDHMGVRLENLADLGEHGRFSQALRDYAEQAAEIVERAPYYGRLVYSGGDDILALLPVHYILEASDELRQTFSVVMASKGFDGSTTSAGIAFVHHTHPLEMALAAAREAEKQAKYNWGRDALVIAYRRRSGEPHFPRLKWEQLIAPELNLGTWDERFYHPDVTLFRQLRDDFASGFLARNLVYDVERLAYAMDAPSVPREARQAEFTRLLKRHTKTKADFETAKERYLSTICNFGEYFGWEMQLVPWFYLARFMAQGDSQ